MPFTNPYNFVPVAKGMNGGTAPSRNSFAEGLTGRLVCTLEPVTPLFIPDAFETIVGVDTHDDPTHKFMDFCKLDGTPFIPGSSIKGMLRSFAEALTGSCMSKLDSSPVAFRENRRYKNGMNYYGPIPDRAKHQGMVTKGASGFQIVPGYEVLFRKWNLAGGGPAHAAGCQCSQCMCARYSVGDHVTVQYSDTIEAFRLIATAINPPGGTGVGGVLLPYVCGLWQQDKPDGHRRGNLRVFVPTGPPLSLADITEVVELAGSKEGAKAVADSGCTNGARPVQGKRQQAEKLLQKFDGCFVYYDVDDCSHPKAVTAVGKSFRFKGLFARDDRAAIGRVPRSAMPCKDLGNLCPCCRLFGTVVDGKDDVARTGRINIGPARLVSGMANYQTVKLGVLSGPKPSCRQFYLKAGANPVPDGYNYHGMKIRGRKFYWHQTNDPSLDRYKQRPPRPQTEDLPVENDQNSTVRLLTPSGTPVFEFAVDFENLLLWELGLLLASLQPSALFDEEALHKLGMGKPLGLGSVKLTLQTGRCYRWKFPDRYSSLGASGDRTVFNDNVITVAIDRFKAQYQTEAGLSLDASPAFQALKILLCNPQLFGEVKYPGDTVTLPSDDHHMLNGAVWFQRNQDQILKTPSQVIDGGRQQA